MMVVIMTKIHDENNDDDNCNGIGNDNDDEMEW